MKKHLTTVAALLALLTWTACPSNPEEKAEIQDPERGSEVVTHWTADTELFVEFPTLAVGAESAFAAHLTTVSDFKPVNTGRVIVVLRGTDGTEERFEVDGPTVPGIFRPIAIPKQAGTRQLTILLESDSLTDSHELGEVTVFASESAAIAAAKAESEEDGISFLKEQQWPIEFAMVEIKEETLRPSLAVSGKIRARPDGEVYVSAPSTGRLMTAGAGFPRIGTDVESDEIILSLAPRLGGDTDISSLQLAASQARLDVDYTRAERLRLEGLAASGAVPTRRVDAARHQEARAQADLTAAQRRLGQHQQIQRTSGSGGGIAIRAPIAGNLVSVDVAPGTFVDEGQPLFHVVDLDRLWLEVHIPEANIGRIDKPSGAWFSIEGFKTTFDVTADQVVVAGGIVDARTRTIPLIFAIENPNRRLRVGMSARVHVLTDEPVPSVVVPLEAVLEDGGQDVIFVQKGGETFERRVVQLGVRDRGLVQILNGAKPGEHVVTKGAFMVKLAASSTGAPATGHAH